MELQFAPAANGTQTGTLTFTDSAGTQTVKLTGTGVAATPTTYFSPSAVSFLPTPVDTEQDSSGVVYGGYEYFYNNGTAPLTIASAKVTAGGAAFYLSPFNDYCTGAVIATGSYCYFNVYFAPTAAGYQAGTITLTDTNGKTYAVPLYGYAPTVLDSGDLSPSSLAFGSQAVGTTTTNPNTQTIYLTNTGTTEMTLGTVGGANVGQGAEFPLYSDGCSGTTLGYSNSDSCSVSLQFAPSTTGTRTGQVSFPVTYSDGTTATFTANLTGSGTADLSKAVLSPTTSQLEDTVAGQYINGNYQTFTLTNVGNLPFVVDQAGGTNTIVGTTTSGDFAASDSCSGRSVAPAGSCTVTIYFEPLATSTGTRTGTLIIPVTYSGATAATNFTATYTGNVVAAVKSLVVTPTSEQFGTWVVNTYSSTSTITLTNNGNVPLTLGSPSTAAPFASRNTCAATLAPNGTCTIGVLFAPTATGAATGTLSIPSNAPGSPAKVTLSATGIASIQQLAFSQSTVAFGQQTVSTTGNQVTVNLINQSSAYVLVKSITLGGTNIGDFTLVSDGCSNTTLYGLGATCPVTVAFSPKSTSTGARTATLTETDNGSGGPRSVALTGTGINPTPAAGIFPTALFYGKQTVGTKSVSQSFSVTNTGTAALKITSIVSTGSSEFVITNNSCNGATLAVGANCLVFVAFDPTLGGTRPGQITITDTAPNSPQLLPLTGLGYGVPKATLSATSVTAPTVDTGKTSTAAAVTLTDNGTDTLVFTSFTITGANAAEFTQTNTCGASIAAPTGSCTITVAFSPTAAGAQTATLNITDNAGNVTGAVQQITLNGTGTGVPQGQLSASTLTFAAQGVGTASAAQTVTLTNPGTAALSIASIALGGTDPGDYSLTNPCGTSLAIGASCSLAVTFKPTTTGSRPATVTITDNAGLVTGTTQTITLAGTGVPLAATPTFTPAAGTYTTTQSVTINDTTTGAAIYYTTNGTAPTTASTKYVAGTPITVAATETIEAIAVATGYAQSPIASATYTITPPTATPTFSPTAGTYTTTQSVTLNDTTTGATIYYTTNGSTPTTSSTKYVAGTPITVSATETIKAIATATGHTQSAVATATYTID